MKGIDTNILLRFLVGDDEQQSEQVYAIFKKAEQERNELFVSLLVVLEMLWVLESVYDISRSDILESIGDLLRIPILHFEQPEAIQQFLLSAQKTKIDLSDLLVAHSANNQGCETTLTFDKKASKFELFELLG